MIVIAAPATRNPFTGGNLANARLAQSGYFRLEKVDTLESARNRACAMPRADLVLADSLLMWDPEGSPGSEPDIRDQRGAPIGHARLGLLAHSLPSLVPGLPLPDRRRYLARETRLLRQFAVVVSPSRFMDRALGRRGVDPARIVRVNLAPVVDGRTRDGGREQNDRTGCPRVLTVANWSPSKGQDKVWSALRDLSGVTWHWTCIGQWRSSPFGRDLRGQIAESEFPERVRLLDSVPPSELSAEYGRADLFVLPSTMESYGLVFAEALSHSLPVIALRCGAVPEVVGDGAVLLPAGDTGALRDAIRRGLTDGGYRRRLSEAAAGTASGFPSWNDSAAELARAIAKRIETPLGASASVS
jgi:glycosyltransferase involved in cell wall biosynthesis